VKCLVLALYIFCAFSTSAYKYTDPWFYTYFKTIKFQDT